MIDIIYMEKDGQAGPLHSGGIPSDAINSDGNEAGAANHSTLFSGNENDGKIVLSFHGDDLEVRGDFFPPLGDGAPISPRYIRDLLEKFNIVYGICREDIQAAYKKCVNERKIVKDARIARGAPPVNEILEYMQLNPLLDKTNARGEADGNVDHRSRSPFIIVRRDQALAKQKSRKPGREGRNVHGKPLAFGVSKPASVSGGENTRMEGRFLLANINGQLALNKGEVSVRDSLVIKGPVGYATGNISFPGDVEIEGPVSDGFRIFSGGSVTIKQTFDVTEAVTKNDLSVAGGIIGRNGALLKVGGNLKTKFIENCRVACRKNIFVDAEIINSNIYTLETLTMGSKGRIVGGEIYAVKGIRAAGIGQKNGKAARIHCGIDFTLEQEKEKNNGILRILAAKLARLKNMMEDPQASGEKREKMEALLARLKEEQRKARERVTELLGQTNACSGAAVEVAGTITAGTLIEICQIALFVTEPINKSRIRLDERSGKLIAEKL